MRLQARSRNRFGGLAQATNKMHKPFDSKMIEHKLALKLLAQYQPKYPKWRGLVLLLTITAILATIYFNA